MPVAIETTCTTYLDGRRDKVDHEMKKVASLLENGASADETLKAANRALDAYWGLLDGVCVEAGIEMGPMVAREQLEREKATMQKEMDNKRKELETLREELEKKGPLLTPEVRRDKQDLFERKRRDAARLADDFQKELERKESMLLQKVLQEVSGIIEKLGKERGYYLVVEKRGAGVIYASAEADLTDEIIRAYDAGAKPPAGGAAAPAKKP